MSDTQFTPGPWRVIEPNGKGNGIRIDGPSDWPRIPEAWLGFQVTSKEQIANAHLIASAPDLYEALDELREELFLHAEGNYFRPFLDKAEMALAKAHGKQ